MGLWAEKEWRNLTRARRAGLPAPTPFEQKEHVLVMSFVGADGWPAPQLAEAPLKSAAAWARCYCQVYRIVRRLHVAAKLVHADLSEYNLLLLGAQVRENVPSPPRTFPL